MQRKFFPLCEGVRGGGAQYPSEGQFWEIILSILTFSRGKNDFDQSCSLWCQKLKKNRLWIVTLVGGGVKTKSVTNVTLFFFFLLWRLPLYVNTIIIVFPFSVLYDDDHHCCHKMIFELNLGWSKDKWSNRDILAGKIGISIRKYYSTTASSRCTNNMRSIQKYLKDWSG